MVSLYESALVQFAIESLGKPGLETGGALHGFIKNDNEIVVTYASGPGGNASYKTTRFQMDLNYVKCLDRVLLMFHRNTFEGNWHKHPVGLLLLSAVDLGATVRLAMRNDFRILVQIIVTCEKKLGKTIIRIAPFFFTDAQNCQYQKCVLNILPGVSPIRTALEEGDFSTKLKMSQAEKASVVFIFPTVESEQTHYKLSGQTNIGQKGDLVSQSLTDQIICLPRRILEKVEISTSEDFLFVAIPKPGLGTCFLAYNRTNQDILEHVFFQGLNESAPIRTVNYNPQGEVLEIWRDSRFRQAGKEQVCEVPNE